MASSAFDSAEHSFHGVEDKLSSSNRSYRSIEGERMQILFSEAEDWGEPQDISSFSDYGFHCGDMMKKQAPFSEYQQQEQLQQLSSDYGLLDDLRYDIASPPIQTCLDEITEFSKISTKLQDITDARKDKPSQFSLTSLKLLRNYGSRFKRLSGDEVLKPISENKKVELSTSETMWIASARFIQSSSGAADDLALLSHPYDSYFSCLTEDEISNIKLGETLLAAAERVGCQQFDAASELLDQCDELCCSTGNPVERVVYYFSEALREKIDRETGRVSTKGLGKRTSI
ncbi:hypothetical protein BT93_A0142 [Corymbia citriodora subsp. variegata]|nr:hypothetical protein BT93_A0142 [Corymbia citriodora subsp. variegata]